MTTSKFAVVLAVLMGLVSMVRLGNFPAYAQDIDGECISVTCADGSVHPCGFD